MKNGKVLLGVLAGAAAGALLGILLAPQKGSITRRKIVRKGEDYLDGAKDKFDELLEEANARFESTLKEALNAARKGKEKASAAVKELVESN